MELSEDWVQVYDPETERVTTIPVRELSDAMIAIRIEGIDGVVYVDQSFVHLEKGPVRHEILPAPLVERITQLAETLDEVLPGSPEEWIDDFRRDEHPETEIVIWEQIANAYLAHIDPDDAPERKQDVLKLLLACANNSPDVARLTVQCPTLDPSEVQMICDAWSELL